MKWLNIGNRLNNSDRDIKIIVQRLAQFSFLWLISGCFLPLCSSLVSIGHSWLLSHRRGAVVHTLLLASSPCLLCSTFYITNHVVITDVTFLMAQLLQTKRLEWCCRVGRALNQESSPAAPPLLFWEQLPGRVGPSVPNFLNDLWNWECSMISLSLPLLSPLLPSPPLSNTLQHYT